MDRAHFPRHAPGETLHPGIEPLLRQLGVWEAVKAGPFIRHAGIENRDGTGVHFTPYHPSLEWLGFQLYRSTFDQILLDEVIAQGATVQLGCRLLGLEMDASSRLEGIRTRDGIMQGDYYVDATGQRSWLYQQMGGTYTRHSRPLWARYGYVLHSLDTVPQMQWHAGGWTWITPVSPTLTAWAQLESGDRPRKRPADWRPEQLQAYTPSGKSGLLDVSWRIADRLVIDNLFLAGDAACVIDPAASHGVLKAIMSGMMVSHLLGQAGHIPPASLEAHYSHWVRDFFRKDMQMLKELYVRHGLPVAIPSMA